MSEVPPMMRCGHQANAVTGTGAPTCVICAGIVPGADEVAAPLDGLLKEREARCSCGALRPSTDALTGGLAFFEYRGKGSHVAMDMCGNCAHARSAHTGKEVRTGGRLIICSEFKPRGPMEYDTYYCGHAGWD
jgi:hypothetical protein